MNDIDIASQELPPPAELPRAVDATNLVDRLLRQPHSVVTDLVQYPVRSGLPFAALLMLMLATYGLVAGSFSGGVQYWMAAVKVLAAALASAAICFPSLHILCCLNGGSQTAGQSFSALLVGMALTALLLVGLAPVAWVFSQSTNSVGFMAFLHWCFVFFALRFGLRQIQASLTDISESRVLLPFMLWSVIFLFVCFQMCTTLRPLIGSGEEMFVMEKKFFLVHWMDTLSSGARR